MREETVAGLLSFAAILVVTQNRLNKKPEDLPLFLNPSCIVVIYLENGFLAPETAK